MVTMLVCWKLKLYGMLKKPMRLAMMELELSLIAVKTFFVFTG